MDFLQIPFSFLKLRLDNIYQLMEYVQVLEHFLNIRKCNQKRRRTFLLLLFESFTLRDILIAYTTSSLKHFLIT